MERLMKYKWQVLFMTLIGFGVGWNIYSGQMNKGKVYLQESSTIETAYEKEAKDAQPAEKTLNKEVIEEVTGESAASIVKKEPEEQQIVPVYICGEIVNPGVYYVSKNAIINEVIEKSGGFTQEADQLAVNLAALIAGNEKIIIPKQGEKIDKLIDSYDNRERTEAVISSQTVEEKLQEQLVNINTASKETLMTLNGIGEVKASAIIAYRQENGLFNSIDEIKNISGIGEKTFEKIKQFITT